VGELIALGAQILVLEKVLLFVVKDEVGALGHAANVRSEHDVVLGLTVEGLAIEWLWTQLEVGSTAVDVLLVLDSVLHYQSLVLVAERGECG